MKMGNHRLLTLAVRIKNTIVSVETKIPNTDRVRSIHLKLLKYLSVCNKYGNIPYVLSNLPGNKERKSIIGSS